MEKPPAKKSLVNRSVVAQITDIRRGTKDVSPRMVGPLADQIVLAQVGHHSRIVEGADNLLAGKLHVVSLRGQERAVASVVDDGKFETVQHVAAHDIGQILAPLLHWAHR